MKVEIAITKRNVADLQSAIHSFIQATTGRDLDLVGVAAEARKDGAGEAEVARILTGLLYDGLAYGNWRGE